MSIRNGHIRWAFKLSNWKPTLDELITATSCIQLEEKQRLSAFVFRDDFDASIIGRLMMRKFVRDATNKSYDQILFHRDERGKPYIQQNDNDDVITFNVSHQGNYTIIAGCIVEQSASDKKRKPRIGADIMKIEYTGGKSLKEFFRIMDRNFTTNEWNYIKRQTSNERLQLRAFMRHWCLKESFVKMLGSGITVPLDKISFNINSDYTNANCMITNSTVTLLQTFDMITDASKLQFEETLLDDEHCVAVLLCDHKEENETRTVHPFDIINFEELINECKPLLNPDINYCESILEKAYKGH